MTLVAADDSNDLALSIVIVSWNTRALLDECLRAVDASLAASPHLSAETWVVDNASSDNSAEHVAGAFPHVRLIRNTENVGFAHANNQALRQARGRFWLLLNSDALVQGTALADLVAVLEAHPDAAVCGPRLLNGDGTLQVSWARFPGLRSELSGALDRSQSPAPPAAFAGQAPDQPFAVDWVGGACFLVRAGAAQKVGLLREDFFMYGEETEWCHRFARAGWKTLLAPGIRVTHLGGQSSQAVPVQTRRRIYQSSILLYGLLYGPVGAAPPRMAATARFLLSGIKRTKNRKRSAAHGAQAT